MKKKIILLLTTLFMLSLVACGGEKKEYYQDTTIEKFETFTSVTGMELNVKKEEEGAIIYNYILDNNADGMGAVYKYESYITEFGFEKDDSLSVGDLVTYRKDDFIIMTSCGEVADDILQYVVAIPKVSASAGTTETSEEVADSSEVSDEEEIENLKTLVSEKKYSEAVDYYNSSNLRDNHFDNDDEVKKYFFYAEANDYLEKGFYGESYDLLKSYCVDFLDSNDMISGIEEKIGVLNGVYENKSVGYSGMYICINNGKIARAITSGELDSSVSYIYSLTDYEFTTGEKAYGMGDVHLGTIDYIIQPQDNGSLLILAPEGSSSTTFSGVYEKTDLNLPEAK